MIITGVISAATIASAFSRFLSALLVFDHNLVITDFVMVLGGIAAWGIAQSATFVNLITVITMAGLGQIVACAFGPVLEALQKLASILPHGQVQNWQDILAGAFLAFYSLYRLCNIGFAI